MVKFPIFKPTTQQKDPITRKSNSQPSSQDEQDRPILDKQEALAYLRTPSTIKLPPLGAFHQRQFDPSRFLTYLTLFLRQVSSWQPIANASELILCSIGQYSFKGVIGLPRLRHPTRLSLAFDYLCQESIAIFFGLMSLASQRVSSKLRLPCHQPTSLKVVQQTLKAVQQSQKSFVSEACVLGGTQCLLVYLLVSSMAPGLNPVPNTQYNALTQSGQPCESPWAGRG